MVLNRRIFGFTGSDEETLSKLQKKFGLMSKAEVVRLALKKLADLEGLT